MRFRLLSRNAIVLIEEMLSNQSLLKLIDSNSSDPLNTEDIQYTGSLVEGKIFTTPYAGSVPKEEQVNVRVFFPKGRINHRVVLGTRIVFEIVVHENLWLMRDKEGNKCLRPYEIMAEIVEQFEDRSIGTLGVIHFRDFEFYSIGNSWTLYTLEAEMMTI